MELVKALFRITVYWTGEHIALLGLKNLRGWQRSTERLEDAFVNRQTIRFMMIAAKCQLHAWVSFILGAMITGIDKLANKITPDEWIHCDSCHRKFLARPTDTIGVWDDERLISILCPDCMAQHEKEVTNDAEVSGV